MRRTSCLSWVKPLKKPFEEGCFCTINSCMSVVGCNSFCLAAANLNAFGDASSQRWLSWCLRFKLAAMFIHVFIGECFAQGRCCWGRRLRCKRLIKNKFVSTVVELLLTLGGSCKRNGKRQKTQEGTCSDWQNCRQSRLFLPKVGTTCADLSVSGSCKWGTL